jgi:hypothetical protein
MATFLQISSQGLSAKKNAASDEKAQDVMRRYATAKGLSPEATPQEVLNFVVKSLVGDMTRVARQQRADELMQASEEEITNIGF